MVWLALPRRRKIQFTTTGTRRQTATLDRRVKKTTPVMIECKSHAKEEILGL
jgi:hypothetical protein